jgi:ABC-type nitrate/sulfonate/bicarbonate transport system ATPase subunit
MKVSTLFITHDVEEALILSDTVYIMNGKPGIISHKTDMEYSRPRDTEFITSAEFAEKKRFILEAIGL